MSFIDEQTSVYDPEAEEYEKDMLAIQEANEDDGGALKSAMDKIGKHSSSGEKISKKALRNIIHSEYNERKVEISNSLRKRLDTLDKDSDEFVSSSLVAELDALRNGAESSSLTPDLLGKLSQSDIIIAHGMLMEDEASDEEIASSVGMTKSEVKRYISSNDSIKQYMQNILDSQKSYDNIQSIRRMRALDNALQDNFELSIDLYKDNPSKLMKILIDYKKAIAASAMSDAKIVINNNSIKNDNRSVKIESKEDKKLDERQKMIANIFKSNEIKID